MMNAQQAIEFAKSSAIAVFSNDGTEDEHRDNIRDTLNDERSAEHEAAAFDAFDAKLAALRGVQTKPVANCPRCSGKGLLPKFGHVEHGICFKCRGSGTREVKAAAKFKPVHPAFR